MKKMQALMLRCEIGECIKPTENRFLHGLQPEIQNVLIDQHYTSLSQLFELACLAEKQLLGDHNVSKFHAPICKDEEQQIEEQRLVVPPSMPNILQDFGDYKQHETNEEEDVHTVFGEISEPTLPLPSTEIEIIGNNICETLQGENPFSTLPLSQAEVHDVSCDKEELCEIDSFIPMPLLVHVNDTHALEPYTSAENKVFIPIPSAPDE